MIKRLILIVALGVTLSGCFIAPIALVGPAVSGFSTASLIQTTITSGANYMVKQSTGKSITDHALDAINRNTIQQSYAPEVKTLEIKILPKSKPISKNFLITTSSESTNLISIQ